MWATSPPRSLPSRFVTALRAQDIEGFKARFRELDVLLMEDVHFFQGKEKMQDMALAVVKNLQAKGGRAIFTSSFSPRELQRVDSQLVSHFCSGILTDMGRPTKDMRCDILGQKAREVFRFFCRTRFANCSPAASMAMCARWSPASTALFSRRVCSIAA